MLPTLQVIILLIAIGLLSAAKHNLNKANAVLRRSIERDLEDMEEEI